MSTVQSHNILGIFLSDKVSMCSGQNSKSTKIGGSLVLWRGRGTKDG